MVDYPSTLPPADLQAAGRNHGQEWDEVRAALVELGLLPKGGAADVAARLLGHSQLAAGPAAPYATGRYYDGSANAGAAVGALGLSTGQIRFCAFYCAATTTFDRIGVLVTTAGAGNAHLGIWQADATTKLPGTVVEDQVVSVAATGGVEATISRSLTGDTLYWLGIIANVSCSVQRIDRGAHPGKGYAALANTDAETLYATFTYGTLTSNPTAAYFGFDPPSIRLRAA